MKFDSQFTTLSRLKSNCLIMPVFDGKQKNNPQLKELPGEIGKQVQGLLKSEIASGKEGKNYLLKIAGKSGFDFLLLIGIGKPDKFERDSLRKFGGVIASALKGKKFRKAAIHLSPALKIANDLSILSQTIVEGISLGAYELLKYKSEPEKSVLPEKFTFVLPARWNKRQFDGGIKTGEIMAWGQNLSRDLIGHPSNYLTPQEMARTARMLGRRHGFNCQVFGKDRIKKLKMNCLLAVNSGSARPPQFIVMKYRGAKSNKPPLCLVGKGITFDAGGISIKPALDMDQMKGDMGGAACVIASMAVAARLRLPINLVGLVPTTENLPSGSAYKPGDILTALNGKTIEVLNTDAEGRLILADALSYAQRLKPAAIVDVATLTGAAKLAFAFVSSALFTNDENLRTNLFKASAESGEKTWEMPLWQEYQDQIRSSIADIKNSGGKFGGMCTAAAFLNNFTGDYPWAHLDIAAVDVVFTEGAYKPKGASGYGVRLVSEFMRNWK